MWSPVRSRSVSPDLNPVGQRSGRGTRLHGGRTSFGARIVATNVATKTGKSCIALHSGAPRFTFQLSQEPDSQLDTDYSCGKPSSNRITIPK